jgi:hypothetical protein
VCSSDLLQHGGSMTHLLAEPQVQLGRNRGCDLVTRLFDAGGAVREETQGLSKFHCRIEFRGDRCFLTDKGTDPRTGITKTSSKGTFLDRSAVPHGQSVELPPDRPSVISLAGPDPQVPGVVGLKAIPWNCGKNDRDRCAFSGVCPDDARPGCLILQRCDRVPERYVLLCKCAALGLAHPDLNGLQVWRQQNAFAYLEKGPAPYLAPGMTVRTGSGVSVHVGGFGQYGLEPGKDAKRNPE